MVDLVIEERESDHFTGYVAGEAVAEFEFCDVHDDGRMWLIQADVKGPWQRMGVGRQMMQHAVDQYGEVWASTASKSEDIHSDTRFLTEEGAKLVHACIRDGLMEPKHLVNPYRRDRWDEP